MQARNQGKILVRHVDGWVDRFYDRHMTDDITSHRISMF